MNARYTIDDWRAVKAALRLGMTIRAAAAASGVDRNAVFRWSGLDGPPDWMWSGMKVPTTPPAGRQAARTRRQRLSYEDRCYIAALAAEGESPGEIAARVGVHRTTVSRELGRLPKGAYDPRAADLQAYNLARRPKEAKLDSSPRLRRAVVNGLLRRHSPSQISERLKVDYPDDEEMRVSAETVYQAIYVQGRGSLRQEVAVEKALRSGRARRRPRSKMPPRPRGKSWVEGCEISTRPPEAEDRAVPGHWEGDLVIGGDMRSCLVTLVERKTRFLVARRFPCHDTRTVVDYLIEMAGSVPDGLRDGLLKTLTWDQGCELADAARFTRETGFKVYFCDPHSPWQKGTNENTNGLIRQYFPKGTDFTKVTDEEVKEMQDQLNSRPRQTLGWLTPAEVLAQDLAGKRAMTA